MKLFQKKFLKKRKQGRKRIEVEVKVNNKEWTGFSMNFLNVINRKFNREPSYIISIVNKYFKSKNEFYNEKYLDGTI
jgi:hypothetical protein